MKSVFVLFNYNYEHGDEVGIISVHATRNGAEVERRQFIEDVYEKEDFPTCWDSDEIVLHDTVVYSIAEEIINEDFC